MNKPIFDKSAAIVQCGHIGDVLLCLPMAERLNRAGYAVTWYAVPPYIDLLWRAKGITNIFHAKDFRPLGEGDQLYQQACRPALEHARSHSNELVICPQINPFHQAEYMHSSLPYVRFMYEVFHRESVLSRTIERPKISVAMQHVPLTNGNNVLINFATHSAKVEIWWQYWSALVQALSSEGISVYYNQQPGFEWAGSNATPYLVEPLGSPVAVAGIASGFDLVLSVSSAPLWSAWLLDVPALCLLPSGLQYEKNSLVANRFEEWDCGDIEVYGDGTPSISARTLVRIILNRLRDDVIFKNITEVRDGDMPKEILLNKGC